MAKSFTLTCGHCQKDNHFDTHEVDGLDEFIEDEVDDARDEARREYADDAAVDISRLTNGERPLMELAIAIRCQNREEAEHWLDRIAAELGDPATEQVQQGRFHPRAKRSEDAKDTEIASLRAGRDVLREALTLIAADPAPEQDRSNWDAIVREHIEIARAALAAGEAPRG